MNKRSWLVGTSLGALALALTVSAAARAGLVSVALPDLRPEGPWAWTLSRSLGITAYLALGLEVLLGLAVSTGAADRLIARARTVELHQWLSTVALSLTAAHALALLGDRFVRFDLLDVLLPFASRHRPFPVAIGIIAAWAAALVHASFLVRKRIGPRLWRALHQLSFAAFAGATIHGLAAGSSSGLIWMRMIYSGSAAAVLGLLALRVFLSPRAQRAGSG